MAINYKQEFKSLQVYGWSVKRTKEKLWVATKNTGKKRYTVIDAWTQKDLLEKVLKFREKSLQKG